MKHALASLIVRLRAPLATLHAADGELGGGEHYGRTLPTVR